MAEELDFDELLDSLGDTKVTKASNELEKKTESVKDWKGAEAEDEVIFSPPIEPKVVVEEIQKTTPVTNVDEQTADYSADFKEVMASSSTFLSRYFEIEDELEALKEEMKDIKATAKEEGVPVSSIIQGIKELTRELKETSEDAKNTEDAKKFIKSSDTFYGNIISKVN